MDISFLQRRVNASELSLDQVSGNTQISKEQKVAEVSRQFEALLLRNILTESQKTQIDTTTKKSATNDIYRDMITNQLADNISRSRSFGLSGSLEKQLGRQLFKQSDAAANTAENAGTRPASSL